METDKDELGRRARQRVSLERGLWALRETAGGEASNIKIKMPLCQLVNIWSAIGEPDAPNEFMCRNGGFEIAGVRLEWGDETKPKPTKPKPTRESAAALTPPVSLAGWYKPMTGQDGKTQMVFVPQTDGVLSIEECTRHLEHQDSVLEPARLSLSHWGMF